MKTPHPHPTPDVSATDIDSPLPLLGGLSAQQFMRTHWQRQPLLIRQAIPGFAPLLDVQQLCDLAAQDDVESRLITAGTRRGWTLARGPFDASDLPPRKQRQWTLLVQGVDMHHDAVHALMRQFRFVPDARLDDVMISFATDGGGVGPHIDSYDVFLLQAHGRRRWRIGKQNNAALLPDLPVRILAQFEPQHDWVLEPGDMLYLPPGWAHDGVAVEGECMTYSIGFSVPKRGELARELLLRMADGVAEELGERLYKDARQRATATPAAIPAALHTFASQAVQAALHQPQSLACALGEYLTEPKAHIWFDAPEDTLDTHALRDGVVLDRRSHMLYDADHIFLNGESWRAAGRDAALMQQLANQRQLDATAIAHASTAARELLLCWMQDGWLHPLHPSHS